MQAWFVFGLHLLMGVALASAAILPSLPASLGLGLRSAGCFLAGLGAALMLNTKDRFA